MGCDIHVQLERYWHSQWVGIPQDGNDRASERNYHRFAKLAGVRAAAGEDYPAPKGLPEDASPLTRMQEDSWGMDAHSASWETLQDFVRICLETEHDPASTFLKPDDPRQEPYEYYFGLYVDEDFFKLEDYRVVFWFDN